MITRFVYTYILEITPIQNYLRNAMAHIMQLSVKPQLLTEIEIWQFALRNGWTEKYVYKKPIFVSLLTCQEGKLEEKLCQRAILFKENNWREWLQKHLWWQQSVWISLEHKSMFLELRTGARPGNWHPVLNLSPITVLWIWFLVLSSAHSKGPGHQLVSLFLTFNLSKFFASFMQPLSNNACTMEQLHFLKGITSVFAIFWRFSF